MKMENAKESDVKPKGRTQIHNVRFYNLSPRSIQTMAYSTVWKKLALSRNDGSIEIWDIESAPTLERTITKTPGNSVEGLAWCSDRLFSAGLSGEIIEWNLETLKPRFKQHVTGNTIWCLCVNRSGTEIALGTEEGYINIFDITDKQCQYKNLFDKQEGRVLCCSYDASGDFLVTGSMGAIRIWDTCSGHAINKMTVTAGINKTNPTETIIWSIQVLTDFTIISGDSRGYISIWDGKSATQIESHQALKADVLAVAVDEEETKLFCAGIEPIIRIYSKMKIKREDMTYNRWVKYLQRHVHDHDVKALVVERDNIYSGGVDGYLGLSSAKKSRPKIFRYGPFLQQPCVSVAPQERLLLLRYTNYLEIWRMGSSSGQQELVEESHKDVEKSKPKFLALDTVPERLLEFKSKNKETIVCSALSPNGRWLCYSTQKEIRLFQFIPGKSVNGKQTQATQLIKVKDLPEQFAPASHVTFIADSMRLIMVNRETKEILIFSILVPTSEILDFSSSPPLDFLECIDTSKHIKDTIKLFTVSHCGSYILAASADRTIAVWSVYQGKHFKHLINLPRYTAATTALTMHTEAPRVVAAFADGKIFEYDLDEMCFTCSDIDRFVVNSKYFCITNIILDPRNPNIFVMQNDSKMFVLEKCSQQEKLEDVLMENSNSQSLKKLKIEKTDEIQVDGLKLKMEKTFEHLIALCWLSSDELVAVCVNPLTLLNKLPNPFRQKIFGSM